VVVDVNARNFGHVEECELIGTFCNKLSVFNDEMICVLDISKT
jgi:hypothetical protein